MAVPSITPTCKFCGSDMSRHQHRTRNTYCCYECAMNDMYGLHLPLGERFARNIQHTSGCWLWLGRQSGKRGVRYGMVNVTPKVKILAHRFSYMIHYGQIPDNLWVLHKCDTPLCVNPEHLFLGTQQDNIADMDAKGRSRRGTPHGTKQRRVSDDEVKEIRRRYAGGESPRIIATEMGVGYGNIFSIVKGKTHQRI